MSAKGRKKNGEAAPEKDPFENFPTPAWAVHRMLDARALPGGRWLEPTAGRGAIIRAVRAVRDDIRWSAIDIQPTSMRPLIDATAMPPGTPPERSSEVVIGDFLDLYPRRWKGEVPHLLNRYPFDVVIGNPPFTLAEKVVRASLELAPIVVMLLRLNFLGSEERNRWFAKHAPDLDVLSNRPIFKVGGSDATEYAWFAWNALEARSVGRVRVLGLTPVDVRKRSVEALKEYA